MAKNPLDSDAYTGNDEQIDDLMDTVSDLVGDVEYLLHTAEHRYDPVRIGQIKKRLKHLYMEDD